MTSRDWGMIVLGYLLAQTLRFAYREWGIRK
jgi:hypothetical protein